ncbi:MAG: hypothetical protein IKO40_10810, partial [Kiritimatiellae bacterium]|nr:hypothetical protein [Kiritimatiellia bacterium]
MNRCFHPTLATARRIAAVVAALALGANAEAFDVKGGATSHRFANGEKTVISFAESGSFTVSGSGTIELLAVGGGGGGGAIVDNRAAGGGAGGLVHKESFAVSAGTYTVTIGAGGAVGANGGNTVIAGNGATVTAYGGGAGAAGSSKASGNPGGSGGGASSNTSGTLYAGGAAAYGAENNLGHDGAAATYAWGCGGGGGAGSSPTKRTRGGKNYTYTVDVKPDDYPYSDEYWNRFPAWGGDGLAFNITGESVYYAGGGAAARLDGNDSNAQGGLGGGGGYTNKVGSAGTDGLGGGGAGGFAGGSGIVIISFIPSVETTDDFALSGGDT